jgi:hypothetical protein
MADLATNEYTSQWNFMNSHVDSAINADGKGQDFLTSSRCIIYAAPVMAITSTSSGNAVSNSSTFSEAATKSQFRRIGAVQGFSWGENRQIEMVFELGSELPYLVPGRTTGQISLSRIMLFSSDVVNTLYKSGSETANAGGGDIKNIRSLKEIGVPMNLLFATYSMKDGAMVYSRGFKNCWLQSRNESISAGQIIVAENVSIMYEDIVNVSFT